MRRLWSVSLALTAFAALAISAPASPAAAAEYPWCAAYGGDDAAGGRNCGFATLEQCQITVRGMGGFCERNGFYTGADERPAKRVRKRHDS